MSIDSITDRFAKLRSMREKLCKQESNWKEASQTRDWLVDQLNELKLTINNSNSTQEEILERVDDLLCVLNPDNKHSEKGARDAE